MLRNNSYICGINQFRALNMDPVALIEKYYPNDSEPHFILMRHSLAVAGKAMEIIEKHPGLFLDTRFVYEAAMLHDIGIFMTDAPDNHCHGDKPYICHGYLGADLLRREGFPRHALVCERHTGAGLSLEQIERENLPVPHRDMVPVSLEEQLICFADKFYSKTRLGTEKPLEKVRKSLKKYGEDGLKRFDHWCELFL